MISVKPKAAPPKHVVPNWVKTVNPNAPPPFTQEYEAKFNSPIPAGIPVEEDPNKGTGDTNYCKTSIISECSAGKIWEGHIKCKFAIKASKHDRCTDFFEGFCKCLKAQIDAGTGTKTLTDCMGL